MPGSRRDRDRSGRRLSRLIGAIDGRNQFYTRKLASAGVSAGDVQDLSILAALPLTTKAELVADQEKPRTLGHRAHRAD